MGKIVKRKPDFILVLLAVFGLGVVVTLLLPMSSSHSVAEPVSALQAGVIAQPVLTSQ
jgi:acyl-CoA synthetase (AMP-forming)/AMP-acid ligase II